MRIEGGDPLTSERAVAIIILLINVKGFNLRKINELSNSGKLKKII